MRIQATDKLKEEDFPGQKQWIGPMFRTINRFIEDVTAALNGGLVFVDNNLGLEHEFSFTYASNDVTFPQRVKWPLAATPKAYDLVNAMENDVPIMVVLQFGFKQDSEGSFVELVDAVKFTLGGGSTGFQSGERYKIRIRVTP